MPSMIWVLTGYTARTVGGGFWICHLVADGRLLVGGVSVRAAARVCSSPAFLFCRGARLSTVEGRSTLLRKSGQNLVRYYVSLRYREATLDILF